MSTKNVFRLNKVYDLVVAGQLPFIGELNQVSGTLFSWGDNGDGQLGTSTGNCSQSSPIQIPGTSWIDVAAGSNHGFARKTDGTLWSWGTNLNGDLGDGTTIKKSSPIQIPGTSWNDIGGGGTSLARKTDGTLWSWGCGDSGQLGNNTGGASTRRSSPVQIPGTSWNGISVGETSLMARKTDGTLWSWGYNRYGKLGNNTSNVPKSSPSQIPGTSWNDVSAGSLHAVARKTDGTLWSWGYASEGKLGDNTTTPKSSPVQIPGTSWNDVSTGRGGSHTLARKTDGTLWAWGRRNYGQIGDNTREVQSSGRSSPVQIPGTSWNGIQAGTSNSFARKTDGTFWSWGYNGSGNLGLNDTIPRSSPVQIPGTAWNDSASGGMTLARKAV